MKPVKLKLPSNFKKPRSWPMWVRNSSGPTPCYNSLGSSRLGSKILPVLERLDLKILSGRAKNPPGPGSSVNLFYEARFIQMNNLDNNKRTVFSWRNFDLHKFRPKWDSLDFGSFDDVPTLRRQKRPELDLTPITTVHFVNLSANRNVIVIQFSLANKSMFKLSKY